MTERAPEVTESVSLPEDKSARVPLREWSLEVVGGPDKGRMVRTLGTLVRVGSDPTNDLVLTDTAVSRRHLEVERTPRGLLLRDVGSRNGIWLQGRQVMQAFAESGDKITIGRTRLCIKQETKNTEVEVSEGESFGAMVGGSEAMRMVFAELRRAARSEMNLLLEGETGSGKELAARAIHAHSAHRHGPFRVLDCNLISEEAAERELFGNARERIPGIFEAAAGGTVFLDEVGELPEAVQLKLRRVLDTREIPIPGGGAKQLDVRIIASTHRNLEEEVRQNRFRGDLYYRLAVAKIPLPPLRSRREDIPLLVKHFLGKVAIPFELSPQMLALLEGYDWPGNVRELRNVIERGAVMQETGNSNWLDFLSHPPSRQAGAQRSSVQLAANLPYHEAKDRVVGDFERFYFAEVMKQSNFDIKLAEEKTGLSMQSLYRLLKKNGLRIKDLKNDGSD